MRVLVTRPVEDGAEIAALLRGMGHEALLAPLLATHFHDGPAPDFDGVQAILVTSANGIRALVRRMNSATFPLARSAMKGEVAVAGSRASEGRRGFEIPIFAVGPQTTQEAQAAGFADVRNADGDARALAQATARWAAPEKGVLLHVCGEDAPGTLQQSLVRQGFDVRRCVLYGVAAATALPPPIALALARGEVDAALFFSPRSARVFCALAEGLPTHSLIAVCISPVTAQALAATAFAEVRTAAKPNQTALLALIE